MRKLCIIITFFIVIFAMQTISLAAEVSNETELRRYMSASGEETVILTEDISSVNYIISKGTKTLDLNGHTLTMKNKKYISVRGNLTITGNGTVVTNDYSMILGVDPGGKLTIENGSIINNRAGGMAISIWGSNADNGTKTQVTIAKDGILDANYGIAIYKDSTNAYGVEVNINGKINAESIGVTINGGVKTTTGNVPKINIYEGSSIIADGAAVYTAGYGVWNINGGKLQGSEALSIKSGTINISGGELNANGNYELPEANNNGEEDTGSAISITNNEIYAGNVKVNINSNVSRPKIQSQNGYALLEATTSGIGDKVKSIDIQDGIFSGGKSSVSIEHKKELRKFITAGDFNTDVYEYVVDSSIEYKRNETYYVRPAHNIVIPETENGKVSISKARAAESQLIKITAIPNQGYFLDTLKVLDNSENEIGISNFEFVMPYSDVTIEATFKPRVYEEGKYTITIKNSIAGHIYDAYQVFKGDLHERETSEGKKEAILSNIEWGDNFQAYGSTIIQQLKDKYKEMGVFNDCTTATDVAEVLSQHPDFANEFTVIVGNLIIDKTIEPTKSTPEDYNYIIDGLDAGYYMVIDSQINEKDDAYSKYLLDVVRNVELEIKAIKPTVRKTVSDKNLKDLIDGIETIDEIRNTATYYPEDNTIYEINFKLEATIPTNQSDYYRDDEKKLDKDYNKAFLAEYNNYEYFIIDVLDKGFALKDNIDVIAKRGIKNEKGEDIILSPDFYTVERITLNEDNIEKYKLTNDLAYYKDKTILKITINNLKQHVINGIVNPGETITFEYSARLNGNHETGAKPNKSEAYLLYSDNPYNSASKSITTSAMTYTYSIDLEILKIDSNNPELYLDDAEFKIYEEKNTDLNIIKTIKTSTITTDAGETKKGYVLFKSLSAGSYQIEETKSPAGYNKLKDNIKLKIDVTADKTTNDATWKIEIEGNDLVELPNNPELVKLIVANTSGYQLPVTGGIGTVIFAIVGLSIMVVAVIALKSNKSEY